MDKKLQILKHLYGEAEDPAALRPLLQDEDLKAEHQALSEMKFLLDHRASQKPPAHVVDAILAAAANPESNTDAPQDRPARAPLRLVRSTWMRAAAVVVILMLVGIWYLPSENDVSNLGQSTAQKAQQPERLDALEAEVDVALAEESLSRRAEQQRENAPPVLADKDEAGEASLEATLAPPPSTAPAFAGAGLQLASTSDSLTPSWDDADEILKYQRRIQMLLDQTEGLAWDEPAVPLELLPGSTRTQPGLHQAGSRARTPGNQ